MKITEPRLDCCFPPNPLPKHDGNAVGFPHPDGPMMTTNSLPFIDDTPAGGCFLIKSGFTHLYGNIS